MLAALTGYWVPEYGNKTAVPSVTTVALPAFKLPRPGGGGVACVSSLALGMLRWPGHKCMTTALQLKASRSTRGAHSLPIMVQEGSPPVQLVWPFQATTSHLISMPFSNNLQHDKHVGKKRLWELASAELVDQQQLNSDRPGCCSNCSCKQPRSNGPCLSHYPACSHSVCAMS